MLNNIANVLKVSGNSQQSLLYFEKSLVIKPDHVPTLVNFGMALHESKQYQKALEIFSKAIEIDPKAIDAYSSKAVTLRELGQLDEALVVLDQALKIDGSHAESYCNQGLMLQGLGKLDEALISYERALAIKPNYPEVLSNRGIIYKEMRKFPEAIASFFMAIALQNDFADAHSNLGLTFHEIEQYDSALSYFDRAIELKENFSQAHYNRGVTLQKIERIEEAIASYKTAIAIDPHFAQPHNNLGVILHELQNLDQSLIHYDAALKDDPNLPDPLWNRSLVYLTLGRYEEGWRDFESRKKATKAGVLLNRQFDSPLWLGKESLEGKTILLVAEQGLGDTLQFCRYVPMVAELGAKVVLEVPKPLENLMKGLEGVSRIIITGQPALGGYDFHCPLMSLPLAFGTTKETIPNTTPYLKAIPEKVQYWKEKLGPKTKKRVGLVWSGGFRPDQPEVWATNKRRNLPIEKLEILKDIDAEFYSLQKGEPAESELIDLQKKSWDGPNIINYVDELKDFTDTAALIENLDLVIAVDTSTAHLAAALNKPTWILNRYDTCWRWFLEQEDSPWYPSLMILRQKERGEWNLVLLDLIANLKELR